MTRLLAACLLVLFASLATTDMFACPDGCQKASSEAAADRCNDTGWCIFCTGGVVGFAVQVVGAPAPPALPTQEVPGLQPPSQPALPLDHPPRPA